MYGPDELYRTGAQEPAATAANFYRVTSQWRFPTIRLS